MLVYVNGGLFECTVGWQPYTNATSYDIYRSTSQTGPYAHVFGGSAASFAHDSANPANLYYCDATCPGGMTTNYYYVTATTSSGTSGSSNILSGVSTSDPSAMVTVTGGNARVIASPSYTGSGNLNLMRATSQTGPWTNVASVSNGVNFTDQPLTNGTRYYYALATPTGTQAGAFCSTVVSAIPLYTSVPINIVPNPPLGFLPDSMTFPSWMESVAPIDAPDAPGGDTATGSGGPSSVLDVNLAHGVVEVNGGADLVVTNPYGPDISFQRIYRTAMAAGNLSSPGLSPGWTHNWDFRIVPLVSGNWGALQLVYPNGASETLHPAYDGNGNPTGQFQSPTGAPYVATGVASSTVGVWTSITLQSNGNAGELFTMPSGDSVYRLAISGFSNGSQAKLYYSSGALTEIDTVAPGGSGEQLLSLSYSSGLLSSVTDTTVGSGRTFAYSSGQLSSVSEINNSGTAEWAYAYTSLGGQPYINSVSTQDPQGNSATASVMYDPTTGRAKGLTDAKGDNRTYNYSGNGYTTVGVNGASGNPDSYQLGYDPTGRETAEINAAGDTTLLSYTSVDPSVVTAIAPPLGSPETVQTDTHGNPTQITEPYGNYTMVTWTYPSYAPLGLVTSVQEFATNGSSKHATTYAYYGPSDVGEPLGYPKSLTMPNGGVTTWTYTALGNVASVVGPSTSLTYTYTGNGSERIGQPSSVMDGLGLVTHYTYDSSGRLASSTDPMGNVVAAQYNEYDQPTNITIPGKTFQVSYNVHGKAAASTSLSGFGTLDASTFDHESGAKSSTDANGNTNSLGLDGQFGLNGVTNGNNQLMHQFSPRTSARALDTTIGTGARSIFRTATADQNGNLSTVSGSDNRTVTVTPLPTDPNRPQYVVTHDANTGSQVEYAYSYDGFGRIQTGYYATWAGETYVGVEHTYHYDDEDNVTDDLTSTGSDVNYSYNLDGTRHTMGVGLGLYTYGYDAAARMTSINVMAGPGELVANVSYTYDNDGRVTAMRTPAMTVFYTYNALGQLTSLQNLTPDGYHWPSGGQGAEVTDSNGIEHTIFNSFSNITYDALGDRTHMDFTQRRYIQNKWNFSIYTNSFPVVMQPGSATWGYDSAGRLTSENWAGNFSDYSLSGGGAPFQPATSLTYSYDAADNLTICRNNTQNTDATSDAVLSTPSNPYLNAPIAYDASTEMTTIGQLFNNIASSGYQMPNGNVTAIYDPVGQVTDLAASQSMLMTYDHLGHKVQEGWNVGVTTAFTYDGDQLVFENSTFPRGVEDSDFQQENLVWGPTGLALTFTIEDDGAYSGALVIGYAFDPQGNCVDVNWAENEFNYGPSYWTNYDIAETYYQGPWTNQVPNDTNGYFGVTLLDAYGSPLYYNNGGDQAFSGDVQYKGQFGYFAENGSLAVGPASFYYCCHRFYDANIGRWISRDPSGLDGGVNTFAYCGGNPIMFVDPSGLYQIIIGHHKVAGIYGHCFMLLRDDVPTSPTYNQMWCFDAGPQHDQTNLQPLINPGGLIDHSGWYGIDKKGHMQYDYPFHDVVGAGGWVREDWKNEHGHYARGAFTLVKNNKPVLPILDEIYQIRANMGMMYVPYDIICADPDGPEGNSNSFVAKIVKELGLGSLGDIFHRHWGDAWQPVFTGSGNDPWH